MQDKRRDVILGWGTAKSSVLKVSPSEVHKMSMSNVRLREPSVLASRTRPCSRSMSSNTHSSASRDMSVSTPTTMFKNAGVPSAMPHASVS